jgi:acetyltransferase-like isoleucine patch superfamily enzyme
MNSIVRKLQDQWNLNLRRARQEGRAEAPFQRLLHRIVERTANAAFIVVWGFAFAWVPTILGRWWRRWFLKIVLKQCGHGLNVSTGVYIEHPWRISVGSNVWIGRQCHLEGMGGIQIGDDAMIALQSVLQSAGHEFELGETVKLQTIVKRPIVIGNDVWIGCRSVIRYDCTIGDEAIVGMGAVVVDDVPPRVIVGGVPAKAIGTRL